MFKSNIANSFLPLFGLYSIFRGDAIDRGVRGLNADVFILFCFIVCGGGYGVSARGCCLFIYSSINASNYRSSGYRLKWLIDARFVVSFRYKGRVRYKISSHAEKLIVKSIGKDQLRSIAQFVRASIKE